LAAAADLEQERQRLHQHWRQQLERARYQTERAARQYQAVEPENRLVARQLERQWEQALQEQQRLEEEYARFARTQPKELSTEEQEQIRSLARDVPGLWQAPTTTPGERQRIVRLLIEQVDVTVRGASDRVAVAIRWVGGSTSQQELVRPVNRYDQLTDYASLRARVQELRDNGMSLDQVAEQLNREGFHPPKRSRRFSGSMVAGFLAKGGRSGPRPRALAVGGLLQQQEWLVRDLARQLEMPSATLHRWIRVGWVQARKLPLPGGHWAIWADPEELDRMARLRHCPRGWLDKPLPVELTTPKTRADH
jgi:hypothetical protein